MIQGWNFPKLIQIDINKIKIIPTNMTQRYDKLLKLGKPGISGKPGIDCQGNPCNWNLILKYSF